MQDIYLKAKQYCADANVLFIADEIYPGSAEPENYFVVIMKMYGQISVWESVKWRVLPVSAVMADDKIMLTIMPVKHGSTYGGNPLAASVVMSALKVLKDEEVSPKG